MLERSGWSHWWLLAVLWGAQGCESNVGPEPVQQVVQHVRPNGTGLDALDAGSRDEEEWSSEEELTSRDLEAELNRLERELQQ